MSDSQSNDSTSEQTLLNQIILEWMKEQKRKRRFRWFIRLVIFAVVVVAVVKLSLSDDKLVTSIKPHAGVIEISGAIAENDAGSAENFAKGMEAAYKNSTMKGVILKINSPGGSPVQADYMYTTIQRYRKKYPDIKVYAVCVDMCASAAYYIAAAAEDVYANPASMVGSIGVVYNGFGFVDTLEKVGMTRRLMTAGRNKGFLDPFSPENPEQKQYLQTMLDEIHTQFIARVKEGRGSRLEANNDEVFSGLFWTGAQAEKLGLIDGFASTEEVARDVLQVSEMVDYTNKQTWLDTFSKNMGAEMASHLSALLGLKAGFRF